MTGEKGEFRAQDGLSIYWKAWLPEGPPKAVIHVIHGYAEHGGRYGFVVNELVPAGYAVFGTDHRGHGRSEGRRGHVECFQEFIDDEKRFREGSLPAVPAFPVRPRPFHGSIIAMNYAEQFPRGFTPRAIGHGSDQGRLNKILIL